MKGLLNHTTQESVVVPVGRFNSCSQLMLIIVSLCNIWHFVCDKMGIEKCHLNALIDLVKLQNTTRKIGSNLSFSQSHQGVHQSCGYSRNIPMFTGNVSKR